MTTQKQARTLVAIERYHQDHAAASSDSERQAVREAYERAVNGIVHGLTVTTAEYIASVRKANGIAQ